MVPVALNVVLLLAASATVAAGPAPDGLVDAPDIRVAYAESQSDCALTDEEKIIAAIRCYLAAKARSYSSGQAVDLAFVVDRSTETGRALYEYETGRIRYTLLCWRYTDLVCIDCAYSSSPVLVTVTSNRAVVEATVSGRMVFSHDGEPFVFEGEQHTFELVRGSDGYWRLTGDTYRDEFTDCYPHGTDFEALIASLPSRYEAWSGEQGSTTEADGNRYPEDQGPGPSGWKVITVAVVTLAAAASVAMLAIHLRGCGRRSS
ncbi:MAG TPA: hypothetical protein DGR79_01030 [Clostridiales bacterium]|nr:hypothetical protein [Clostridiales bacterium]